MRLEHRRIILSHPLEINIKFMYNHIINSAESLSFRRVKKEVREKLIELFKDGHSPASALYTYEDEIHLNATNEQDILEKLADWANNPDYDYVAKLFQQHRKTVVENYNNLGLGKAILQEYDTRVGKSYVLCIVTNLMFRVHEKVLQSGELCYMDASASFDPLNTSITLLCTSCAVGALPLGLFITSDESEVTLKKAVIII